MGLWRRHKQRKAQTKTTFPPPLPPLLPIHPSATTTTTRPTTTTTTTPRPPPLSPEDKLALQITNIFYPKPALHPTSFPHTICTPLKDKFTACPSISSYYFNQYAKAYNLLCDLRRPGDTAKRPKARWDRHTGRNEYVWTDYGPNWRTAYGVDTPSPKFCPFLSPLTVFPPPPSPSASSSSLLMSVNRCLLLR